MFIKKEDRTMELLDDVCKLEGKVIKTCKIIEDDTQLALTFDDGTYALFIIAYCHECNTEIELETDVHLLSLLAKKELGIISDDEYEEILRVEKEVWRGRREKEERAQLAKLTEKYQS